jgi:hypothetical protein
MTNPLFFLAAFDHGEIVNSVDVGHTLRAALVILFLVGLYIGVAIYVSRMK